MTADLEQIKENSMVRYGFKILLMREFGITIRETETQKLMQAADCIEIYVSMEDFLERSGWRRDNPELCEESYLVENRICRYIQGKVWYFSRLRFESQMITESK